MESKCAAVAAATAAAAVGVGLACVYSCGHRSALQHVMEAEIARAAEALRQRGRLRRILIIGSPGSGKSTVARELGKRTGLPVVHMDRLWFEPNNPKWEYRPANDVETDVRRALRAASWIFEGNHDATGPEAAASCTMLVHLDLPSALCAWRAYWRYQTYSGSGRPDLPEGCAETFDFGFYREILASWKKGHATFIRQVRSKAHAAGAMVITLRTAAALDQFRSAIRTAEEPDPALVMEPVDNGPWQLGYFAAHKAGVFTPRLAERPQDNFDDEEQARICLRNQVAFANPSGARNPYASAIDALPDVWSAQPTWPEPPDRACEATPLTLVDSAHEVDVMMEALEGADMIGLDIEHYQQRSFYGLVSTLQISTVAKGNFLIDTLEPAVRRAIREKFQNVASNPDVIKVMHLDKNDTMWLQKDFDIFLVNVFSVGEAAQEVGLPLNFGDLLFATCGVRQDKSCQTADWTQRPLPVHLAYYAIADVHYLLPVAADLWRRLLELDDGLEEQPRLRSVCKAGKNACLPVMQLRVPATVASDNTPQKRPWAKDINFKNKLKKWHDREIRDDRCIADLYLWRDSRCRTLDEGVNYVCTTDKLLALARQRPSTPEDVAAILGSREDSRVMATELAQLIAQSEMEPEGTIQPQHSAQPVVEAGYSAAHCLIFDQDLTVAVVRSQKPNQSSPKYSDVGGKRERNESDPWQTLLREADEETGWDLRDTSLFQVLSSQSIPNAKSVAYLIAARNQAAPQPRQGDTIQEVLKLRLDEAEQKLDYRGRQCIFAFRQQVRWQSEFEQESFWEVPVLSRLERAVSVDAYDETMQGNHHAVDDVVPSLHYRYSKPGICLLAPKPLLLDDGWETHGTISLQEQSLRKLAELANLLFQAVHGRSLTEGRDRNSWKRLVASALVLPTWPANDFSDQDKAAMALVEHSTLKRIGCSNSSVVHSCESVLARSVYAIKGKQHMYISCRALAPGSAHALLFQHETQGMVSYAGYIERQYQCSVDAQDRALEVESLPLVDGQPKTGTTKLVAGWTILFPNLSRACVIAAGQVYRSLGFEQKEKNLELFSVWVGNLSYTTTNQQLRELFPDSVYAHVVRDPERSHAHGFVDFASELAAQHALSAAPVLQLNGRSIRVDWAKRAQYRSLAAERDRLCCKALSMGLSLGKTGITVSDMCSALKLEAYGSHEQLALESGRWGKLGDAVVELAARYIMSEASPGRLGVACSSCMKVHHLVGLATQREGVPGGCPYCQVRRRVSNECLASVYDRWISNETSHSAPSMAPSFTLDGHTKGDCVEACFAVVAHRYSLVAACKLFAWVTQPLNDQDAVYTKCFSLQAKPTSTAVGLGSVLLEEFGPADDLTRGATAHATWQWTKCVLIGEAVTNLCVLLFHFRTNLNASKDELHRLQRTEPSASVRSSCLAEAAGRGGVMSWLRPAAGKYTDGDEDDALAFVQSECWKAAIGVLLLCHGGMDDDESWDVGGGVIYRYLLQAEKLPTMSDRRCVTDVVKLDAYAVEPELEAQRNSDPKPRSDSEPEPQSSPESPPAATAAAQEALAPQKDVAPEVASDPSGVRVIDLMGEKIAVESELREARLENKRLNNYLNSILEPEPAPQPEPEPEPTQPETQYQQEQMYGLGPKPISGTKPPLTLKLDADVQQAAPDRNAVDTKPASQESQLALIVCVCKNCNSFLCRADSLRLEGHQWPPLLQMPQPTLRLGEHPDADSRRKRFGKAICIRCDKDVGPTKKGVALLKAQKKAKVIFKREGEDVVSPAEFLAMYVNERPL